MGGSLKKNGGGGGGAAPPICKHNARMVGSYDLKPPPPFANTMLASDNMFFQSFVRLKRVGGLGGAQPPPLANTMLTSCF